MTTIKMILQSGEPIKDLTVEGWVATVRTSKQVVFVAIGDGSCGQTLQAVVSTKSSDLFALAKTLTTGCAVCVRGALVASPAKGQTWELQVADLSLVGDVADDYPLQKKRHSFEFLRTIPHLRPRAKTFGAVFRVRHALQMAIHRFFDERGFIQVHTPIITGSDCEGAGAMFRVTTLDLNQLPVIDGAVDFSQDFFGQETALTVSGQLEGEAFAQAFKNIYTFGPTFRAENSHTPRHAAEFWMVEPEMAFCDLNGDMALAQAFIKQVIGEVLARCGEDIDFFNQWIEKGLRSRLEKVVNDPFETMAYKEAVKLLAAAKTSFEYPVSFGVNLQSEHERYLCEQVVGRPLFLIDYPRDIKAFYMRVNDDGETVAAMDLLVPHVGEIIGGAQREERVEVLDEQMARFGLSQDEYRWYRDLRRYGGVPHAGFGLGFERALLYLTGMANIRDVIPYPRTAGSAGP